MGFKIGDLVVLKEVSTEVLEDIYTDGYGGIFIEMERGDKWRLLTPKQANTLKGVIFKVTYVSSSGTYSIVESEDGKIESNTIEAHWFTFIKGPLYGGERDEL